MAMTTLSLALCYSWPSTLTWPSNLSHHLHEICLDSNQLWLFRPQHNLRDNFNPVLKPCTPPIAGASTMAYLTVMPCAA